MPGPGTLALVGSGEFLDAMVEVDRGLLAGRPPRAVFLPTASAEEGEASVSYWVELGRAHFERLGAEAVPLRVLTRADAEDARLAAEIAGAGLVYLSGGNPAYLADTLRDTAVWNAIVEAWQNGSALAGCSAGASALTTIAGDSTRSDRFSGKGLSLVTGLAVIPHFDRIAQWVPGITERVLAEAPPGAVVAGIDEDTAIVGDGHRFRVAGRQSAWRIERDGTRTRYKPGDLFEVLPELAAAARSQEPVAEDLRRVPELGGPLGAD